jgi:hypothetical protein
MLPNAATRRQLNCRGECASVVMPLPPIPITSYFSTDLLLILQKPYLTFASKKEGSLGKLNSKQVCQFVRKLCAAFDSPTFNVQIIGRTRLQRNKIIVDEKEWPLEDEDFNSLLQDLIKYIPELLIDGAETHPYVVAITRFVRLLAEKFTLQEGQDCFKKLKSGVHDEKLLKWYSQSDCDTSALQDMFFSHCDLIRCAWLLRTLLLKKMTPAAPTSQEVAQSTYAVSTK